MGYTGTGRKNLKPDRTGLVFEVLRSLRDDITVPSRLYIFRPGWFGKMELEFMDETVMVFSFGWSSRGVSTGVPAGWSLPSSRHRCENAGSMDPGRIPAVADGGLF